MAGVSFRSKQWAKSNTSGVKSKTNKVTRSFTLFVVHIHPCVILICMWIAVGLYLYAFGVTKTDKYSSNKTLDKSLNFAEILNLLKKVLYHREHGFCSNILFSELWIIKILSLDISLQSIWRKLLENTNLRYDRIQILILNLF